MRCGTSVIQLCTRCNNNPCECSNSLPATPTPYYNPGYSHEECHEEHECCDVYKASFSLTGEFIVPIIGETTVIHLNNVTNILVGTYLWSPTYGYFLITDYDALSGDITILNTGYTGNAEVGSLIPGGTGFIITDNPHLTVPG